MPLCLFLQASLKLGLDITMQGCISANISFSKSLLIQLLNYPNALLNLLATPVTEHEYTWR